ncbi:hypothetical protein [Streptomyces sp. NPDC086766]|uniref:hypothetical protein n=1 Tax=Streptomyces sp. NPDC086766 TaxID=3365754 RepID=UPI0037F575BE
MRVARAASAALPAVAALALAAPAAVASGGDGHPGGPAFRVGVRPSTVAPGAQVTLEIDRGRGGCRGPATVSSGVFDAVSIPRGRSSRTVRGDGDARPGAVYQVTFTCDGHSGAADLTIAGGHGQDGGGPAAFQHGARAGGGGTLAGLGLGELGMGTALVTGALGTAYCLARRRAGEDGT